MKVPGAMRTRVLAGIIAVPLLLAGCTSDPAKPTGASTPEVESSFDVPCPPAFLPPSPGVDKTLPDVIMPCLDGSSASVAMRGTPGVPMLVNMWASWCDPCREEMTYLNELTQKAAASVQVLGVATIDRRSAATSFAVDFKLAFPSVFDSDGVIQKSSVLKGLPGTLFVDAKGAVVHIEAGPFTSYADLTAKVNKYLGVVVA